MKTPIRIFIWMGLLLVPGSMYAQKGNDDPSFTSNVGVHLSLPQNPTAHFLSEGWGVEYGAGYNFTRRHALIGEFMWNSLYPTNGALEPIRVALNSREIDGHAEVFALTGNYRFESRGRTFGTYFIGGGGWYYRDASLSKPIPTGIIITCDPTLIWWGYHCTPGAVIANTTIASTGSSAFGLNGGIGFTIRVGPAPYRFYVESRYHYAPTKNVNTQLVAITVGFRY